MAFTYAPDFVIKRKRRGLPETHPLHQSFTTAVQGECGQDVPGWTVLQDDTSDRDEVTAPNDGTCVQRPTEPMTDQDLRALTVEDFLRWSVRTPPAKRYGGRKQRRAKQQSRLPGTSEHHPGDDAPRFSGNGVEDSAKAPSSKMARKQRARKPKSLASCTFTTAALSHGPTTQIGPHTGGRVPLTFVDVDEDIPPQPASKKGRLVDPRKSIAFLDMPSPPPVSTRSETRPTLRPSRRPITKWMLRTADVRNASRGHKVSHGRAPPYSPTVTDRDQARCTVFPFALVPLEEHEASLQSKKRQLDVPAELSGAACRKTVREEEEPPWDAPRPAVTVTPVPPRQVHNQVRPNGRYPGKPVHGQVPLAPPDIIARSPRSRFGQSASSEDPRQLLYAQDGFDAAAIAMSGESSDAVQDTSTSTATSTYPDCPNRAGTCNSLADRPDRAAAVVGSSNPTNTATLAVTSDACAVTFSSTRSLGDTGAIGTLALTTDDIPVEKSVRLRPLASYLDSLRETARAATQLQSAANQEECGLSAKSRSTKSVGQLLQNGGPSVADRSARYRDLRSQTTMDRNARGSPAPYARTEATREHHSRRAIRPRPVRVQGGKSSPRFLAYNHTERFGSPMLLAAEGDMNELVGDEEYDSMLTSNLDLFSGYRGG